jgi:hypothetical protein
VATSATEEVINRSWYETLILSFSMPNFYFHVVTAYDILRMRGVPIGKRDYEGRLRTRSY